MSKQFALTFIILLFFSVTAIPTLPDLSKKEDLRALGIGKIVEKDGSIITKINLEEVNDNGIVYKKDESLHDIAIGDIRKIEFLKTPWGSLEIIFIDGKPKINLLYVIH